MDSLALYKVTIYHISSRDEVNTNRQALAIEDSSRAELRLSRPERAGSWREQDENQSISCWLKYRTRPLRLDNVFSGIIPAVAKEYNAQELSAWLAILHGPVLDYAGTISAARRKPVYR